MQQHNSSEMHKKTYMVSVEAGKPSLTSEILHYYLHNGCISIKNMRKREDGLVVIFIPRFQVWFKITHFQVNHFSPTLGIPVAIAMASVDISNVTPKRLTYFSCIFMINIIVNSR